MSLIFERLPGVNSLRRAESCNAIGTPIAILFPEVPEFGPVSVTASNAHFVGPLLWDGLAEDETVPDLGEMIYCTFGGTMFDVQGARKIIMACAATGYSVLVSLGPNLGKVGDDWPANVHVRRFVHMANACARAKLVVCHGGHGSIMAALQNGVPLVCIPYNLEQMHYSQRVQDLGCGINLNPMGLMPYWPSMIIRNARALSEDGVRQTLIEAIATPSYRAQAKRMQANMSPYTGAVAATTLIFNAWNQRCSCIEKLGIT